jgi:hypothetical protein
VDEEFKSGLSAGHLERLRWFEDHAGQIGPPPPPLGGNRHLVSGPQGIFKPEGLDYALSIKIVGGSRHGDSLLIPAEGCGWLLSYPQEGKDLGYYTNSALGKCVRDRIPVGVIFWVSPSPARYKIMGVALPVRWHDGYFFLESLNPRAFWPDHPAMPVLPVPDELHQLQSAPQPELDVSQGAPGWAAAEIQSTVAAYFAMLRAELAGQSYVKADSNRQVQAATGRSRGAVEFKFANVSAVLRDIGLPYVLGYQPRGNYQGALRAEVEKLLVADPEMARLLEVMPTPDLPLTVELVEVEPPVTAPPNTTGRGQTIVGVDYLEREMRNRDVGLRGELLVVEYERAWLSAQGRPDLAEQVAHVPGTLGDGAGYDVSSFLLDGSPHHIEVKTTRGSITAPFFLSESERRYAFEPPGAYSIYRIFNLGPNPGFYKLTGNMAEILHLTPVSYQVRVKAPDGHSTV